MINFGRHVSNVTVWNETQRVLGEDIRLIITDDGCFELKLNAKAVDSKEAVYLNYVQGQCLLQYKNRVSVKGNKLQIVGTPDEFSDVVNKYYVVIIAKHGRVKFAIYW